MSITVNADNFITVDSQQVPKNTPCILIEQGDRKLVMPVRIADGFLDLDSLPNGLLESLAGIAVDINDAQVKTNTPIAVVEINGQGMPIPIMSGISVMNGGLAMCGRNYAGQLGFGDYVRRDTITQVGNKKWNFVASSPSYSAAIDDLGFLYDCGKMATSTAYGEPNPTLARVAGINWKSIACSPTHNMAIDTDGKLYAWGYNYNGILGVGSEDMFVKTPTIVSGLGWSSVAVTSDRTWGIDVSGHLYAWGDNQLGGLGLGDSTIRKTPTQIGSKYWSRVSASEYHCMAIDSGGQLYAWGNSRRGLLGVDSSVLDTPTLISSKHWGYVSTAAGNNYAFTLAIDNDGYLWGWGDNSCGQLGLGDNITRTTPTKIGDKRWSMVSAAGASQSGGYCHALAIDRDGYLWGWGDNSYGQLGWGKTRNSPQQIGNQKWTSVSTSTFHSVFIR